MLESQEIMSEALIDIVMEEWEIGILKPILLSQNEKYEMSTDILIICLNMFCLGL